jgi:hypothetical protein
MRLNSLPLRGFLLSVFIFGGKFTAAHDLSASYATIRFKPDAVELEVKIAGESAWALVQASVAPGVIFVMEEFEKVGQPILLKFAQTMEELTVDGKVVAPRETKVIVAEDNFIFTFIYPRPAHAATLKENYLKRTPPDYVSRVVVVDAKNEIASSKTLRASDLTFGFSAPPDAPAEKKNSPPIVPAATSAGRN